MNQPEFTALQVTLLVRTIEGDGVNVRGFFDDVSFQYQIQDTLGKLLKEQLKAAEVDFEEVIISLDNPAAQAKRVRSKLSLREKLFGRS